IDAEHRDPARMGQPRGGEEGAVAAQREQRVDVRGEEGVGLDAEPLARLRPEVLVQEHAHAGMRLGEIAHDGHGLARVALDGEHAERADVALGRADEGVLDLGRGGVAARGFPHGAFSVVAAPPRDSMRSRSPGGRASRTAAPASVEAPWDLSASTAQAAARPGWPKASHAAPSLSARPRTTMPSSISPASTPVRLSVATHSLSRSSGPGRSQAMSRKMLSPS